MSNLSIYIIEDEGLIAEDIAAKLRDLGYDVMGMAASSAKAVDFLSRKSPDLVLCDINIRGDMDGIEVAEMFSRKNKIPFIFLTSLTDRNTLERAKRALPYGYIVKPFTEKDLWTAIEIAFYKHSVELEKLAISKEKIDAFAQKPLSAREFDLLLDITLGLNNAQIVEKQFISLNTVKFHIRNLFGKLQVSNRAGALHKIIEMLSQ